MARRLSDMERRLWARAMRDVRLAPGRSRPVEDVDPDNVALKSTPASGASAFGASSGPSPLDAVKPAGPARGGSTLAGPPHDVSGHRRIRRGQTEIDARLDLHGHTQDGAMGELAAFLRLQQAMGARCVLVITGKGRAGRGIIRSRLLDWLSHPDLRPLVAGYSRAHPRHGGDGAFYVLIKAKATQAR